MSNDKTGNSLTAARDAGRNVQKYRGSKDLSNTAKRSSSVANATTGSQRMYSSGTTETKTGTDTTQSTFAGLFAFSLLAGFIMMIWKIFSWLIG